MSHYHTAVLHCGGGCLYLCCVIRALHFFLLFFFLTFSPFSRKAGGRCGFAESMPQERITALKMEETSVEMTDVADRANDIVQKAEVPHQTYPFS